jgi:hypothetical protein
MPGVAALDGSQVGQALRLLGGDDAETGRTNRSKRLAELLRSYGAVRSALDTAPPAARDAFARLVMDGPAPVDVVLGRGWWGRGTLPPPLDWLQARALVVVDAAGVLHAVDEAREGFLELTLDLSTPAQSAADPVRVEAAGCVVVGPNAEIINRAVAVAAAQLRSVSATVAVSGRTPLQVSAALRSAGIALDGDTVVAASPAEPALPGTAEQAAGPRAIRALLDRALAESRQVRLEYFASSRAGAATDRVVDPWDFESDLLRGYCHLRQGERTFAVDRIGKALLLPTPIDHPEADAG